MSDPINSLLSGLPLTSLAEQSARLRAINESLLLQQIVNQQSKTANRTAGSSSNGSVLGTIGSFLGGGLGVAPLLTGLTSLFGGGDSTDAITPPTIYRRPLPVNLETGFSSQAGGRVFASDSGQGGVARPITNNAPAQITVNVQAMDSRSFLDRSADIALAVRQAMLESSVLNDVIREV
ncbi:MAG: hypothetical protein ABL967_16600 [Bryobacteraceae bacterium]